MTLEQRINMLEITVASQQVEIAELRNPAAINAAIQSALQYGGCSYTALKTWAPFNAAGGQVFIDGASINAGEEKAAQIQTAKSYEEIFEEKLDTIISLLPPLKL